MNDLIQEIIEVTVYAVIAGACLMLLLGLNSKSAALTSMVNDREKKDDVISVAKTKDYLEDSREVFDREQVAVQIWGTDASINIIIDNVAYSKPRDYQNALTKLPAAEYYRKYVGDISGKVITIIYEKVS